VPSQLPAPSPSPNAQRSPGPWVLGVLVQCWRAGCWSYVLRPTSYVLRPAVGSTASTSYKRAMGEIPALSPTAHCPLPTACHVPRDTCHCPQHTAPAPVPPVRQQATSGKQQKATCHLAEELRGAGMRLAKRPLKRPGRWTWCVRLAATSCICAVSSRAGRFSRRVLLQLWTWRVTRRRVACRVTRYAVPAT
jgi:hypothetical protein